MHILYEESRQLQTNTVKYRSVSCANYSIPPYLHNLQGGRERDGGREGAREREGGRGREGGRERERGGGGKRRPRELLTVLCLAACNQRSWEYMGPPVTTPISYSWIHKHAVNPHTTQFMYIKLRPGPLPHPLALTGVLHGLIHKTKSHSHLPGMESMAYW